MASPTRLPTVLGLMMSSERSTLVRRWPSPDPVCLGTSVPLLVGQGARLGVALGFVGDVVATNITEPGPHVGLEDLQLRWLFHTSSLCLEQRRCVGRR